MERIKIDLNIQEDRIDEEDMLNVIYGNKETVDFINKNGLKIENVQQHLGSFYDFACDKEYCKHCPGLGKCEKNNAYLITELSNKKGQISSSLSPCKIYLKRMELEKKFLIADFPNEWFDKNLRDVDPIEERKPALLKYVKFSKRGDTNWIYLQSKENSGSSFFATMMCIDAANKNIAPICFVNCHDEIEDLASLYYKDRESFDAGMYRLYTCKVLVFDDFGKENKNNLTRDQIVLPLLKYRHDKGLFTIFTSGVSISKLATSYATSKAGEENASLIGKILKEKCGREVILSDLPIYG